MLILGVSGSLRKDSFNTALLRAAAEVTPDGCRIEPHTLHGIPVYDGDLEEREGIPKPVAALKDAVADGDGLLLVTPEYNHGVPGVLKNALDWMTRPPSDSARVFRGRPVAIMGATPGGFGTFSAQTALLPFLRALRLHPWFGGGSMMISRAHTLFDDGRLSDEETRKRLSDFVTGFAQFIDDCRGGGA